MKLTVFVLLALVASAWSYRILCVFPVPSKSHNHLGQGIVGALLKAGHETTMKLAILLLALLSAAQAHKILCMFPVPTRSHNILGKGVATALLKAGHEVTYVTPYPDIIKPAKGLRVVSVSETTAVIQGINVVAEASKGNYKTVLKQGRQFASIAITNKEVQDILTKESFDAVVSEWFFSDVNAGLAAVLQVPWILLSGTVLSTHMESLVDDIRTVPLLPNFLMEVPVPMTLWQRLINTAAIAGMTFGTWQDQAQNEELYHELFQPIASARGVTLPPYYDALYNVSILLSNSHPSMSYAQSIPPNVVQVAGYHLDEKIPPLPKDLQDLLDNSKNGVVYFSMGSVVKSSILPVSVREDLIRILGALPYTVLWKFEEPLEGLPKNVHVRPWMPQPSILAHPNVKLFITHGGILSSIEALNAGVPLLAIPVYGDQSTNAFRAKEAGYALSVPYQPWSPEKLEKALKDILSDDSYHKAAKRLSKIFHTRPVAPSELVSHYIEVAIETKGAYHLRSPARHYAWYARYMLDQWAIVLTALYIVIRIVKAVFRTIKNLFVSSDRSSQKESKKSNKNKKKQ